MMLKSALLVFLWSCFLGHLDCTDRKQVTVKHGENATLECHGHRGAAVMMLKWQQQSEVENTDTPLYVLYVRENRPYEKFQLPSFKGRVQLKDPEMKDGDLSVIIKNVSVNDAGIYECYAGYGREDPQLMSSTSLKVEKSVHEQLTVKRGENAILQCYSFRSAAVVMLKWGKLDLQSELENLNKQLYVLYVRENRNYENYQLPSFKGRVQLRDPQLNDGDLSVIIKNVSMNDAGIYECYAGSGRQDPQLMNIITLKVEEPGSSGARSGDGGEKDVVMEDGGEKCGSSGLEVVLPVAVVLLLVVGGVGFMIYRNRSNPQILIFSCCSRFSAVSSTFTVTDAQRNDRFHSAKLNYV